MSDLARPALLPTRPTERILALDVARGMALFGIFMVNVQIMTQPIGWLISGEFKEQGTLAAALHYTTRVLFESKSYPLFSMLFGMGMALMYQRAKALHRPFVSPYLRRLSLLLVFGLLHALLLWFGDILFYYAIIGLGVMWIVGLRPRHLMIVSVSTVVLAALTLTAMTFVGVAMNSGTKIPETTTVTTFAEFWQALKAGEVKGGPVDPAWMAGETDAFANGPYINAVGMRAINWLSGIVFWLIFNGTGLHIIGMFTLGAAIMKADPFSSTSKLPSRFILLALLVGLPGSIGAVVLGEWGGMGSLMFGLGAALTMLVGPLLSLGYFGLAIRLTQHAGRNPLVVAIASAGRLGLTNYIMQTVAVAIIAQHWGMGRFGDVSRVEMVLIVLAIYTFQLVYSPIYLRVFAMGPLEYLWRTATYLRLPRLRAGASSGD